MDGVTVCTLLAVIVSVCLFFGVRAIIKYAKGSTALDLVLGILLLDNAAAFLFIIYLLMPPGNID